MSSRFAASFVLALALAVTAGCTLLPRKGSSSARPADEGELGPLHAAHRDQIIFARQAIPRDGGVDVALADQLRADEPIWARVYLSRPLAASVAELPDPDNNCKWDNRRELRVVARVDGGERRVLDQASAGDKTWFSFRSMGLGDEPVPLLATEAIIPNRIDELEPRALLLVAGLADGTHDLTIELEASCMGVGDVVVARGTLKLVVDAAARANLVGRIRLAAALMRDPAELARLTKAAAAVFADATLVDFRVMDETWSVERTIEGNPLSRHVFGLTYYRKGDECTIVGSKIVEEHQGGGSYGAPVFLDPSLTDWRLAEHTVPCDIDTTR
jgi:hypothetical protein